MLNRYRHPDRWEKFRDFFTLKVMRLLIFWFASAPVVYSLLDGIQTPLHITLGEQSYNIALELPFNWETLWLASLCYFVAFVIYLIFCPKYVKDYTSFEAYKEHGHDMRWIVWEIAELLKTNADKVTFHNRVTTKGFALRQPNAQNEQLLSPISEQDGTVVFYEYDDSIFKISSPKNEADEKGLFWEVFGRYSSRFSYIRGFIRLLLDVTILLFSLVVIYYVWRGLSISIPNIFQSLKDIFC